MSALLPPNNVPPKLEHITIPDTLSEFQVDNNTYLRKRWPNPDLDVDGLATGAVVFNGNRILLIQRSLSDSMPGKWEIPGGAVDDGELVLQAVARELWEEAGLHASKFISEVGKPWSFFTRNRKRIFKFNFVVQCEETLKWGDNRAVGERDVEVKLDPEEHQDWVWANRMEVENGVVGARELEITTPEQRQVIFDAFALRDQFLEQKAERVDAA